MEVLKLKPMTIGQMQLKREQLGIKGTNHDATTQGLHNVIQHLEELLTESYNELDHCNSDNIDLFNRVKDALPNKP